MSTSQLVCVKRPEPGLSAIFEDMYMNERLVDVTLSCCDGQIQAHKLVLAACSPYFSGLFDKLANPFHYPVIVIKDLQLADLRLIVDFMYRGQLTVSQEKLMSLIKSAEGLQINGLSNYGGLQLSNSSIEQSSSGATTVKTLNQRFKRTKKNATNNQILFPRAYQQTSRNYELDDHLSPQPEKMLEQSMTTGDSIDDNIQTFTYSNNSDPTSTRNLNNSQQQLPAQQLTNIDHHNQQLTNQLQVLSHSLAANRSSSTTNQASMNGHSSGQQSQQSSRSRVHPCQICWKTFREKANLKRHLQVHSIDRVIYACPDCNKTFSWKDNYIRHTKTAHHMNNARHSAE